jgi:hypothetical protein
MGNPQLICSAPPSDYSDRFVLPDNDARFTEEDLARQIASAIQAWTATALPSVQTHGRGIALGVRLEQWEGDSRFLSISSI